MGGWGAECGGIENPARMRIFGGGQRGRGGVDGTMGSWAVDTGICGIGGVSVGKKAAPWSDRRTRIGYSEWLGSRSRRGNVQDEPTTWMKSFD